MSRNYSANEVGKARRFGSRNHSALLFGDYLIANQPNFLESFWSLI
jgi:hypothetical protein